MRNWISRRTDWLTTMILFLGSTLHLLKSLPGLKKPCLAGLAVGYRKTLTVEGFVKANISVSHWATSVPGAMMRVGQLGTVSARPR